MKKNWFGKSLGESLRAFWQEFLPQDCLFENATALLLVGMLVFLGLIDVQMYRVLLIHGYSLHASVFFLLLLGIILMLSWIPIVSGLANSSCVSYYSRARKCSMLQFVFMLKNYILVALINLGVSVWVMRSVDSRVLRDWKSDPKYFVLAFFVLVAMFLWFLYFWARLLLLREVVWENDGVHCDDSGEAVARWKEIKGIVDHYEKRSILLLVLIFMGGLAGTVLAKSMDSIVWVAVLAATIFVSLIIALLVFYSSLLDVRIHKIEVLDLVRVVIAMFIENIVLFITLGFSYFAGQGFNVGVLAWEIYVLAVWAVVAPLFYLIVKKGYIGNKFSLVLLLFLLLFYIGLFVDILTVQFPIVSFLVAFLFLPFISIALMLIFRDIDIIMIVDHFNAWISLVGFFIGVILLSALTLFLSNYVSGLTLEKFLERWMEYILQGWLALVLPFLILLLILVFLMSLIVFAMTMGILNNDASLAYWIIVFSFVVGLFCYVINYGLLQIIAVGGNVLYLIVNLLVSNRRKRKGLSGVRKIILETYVLSEISAFVTFAQVAIILAISFGVT